jgi:hypothetical protein
MLNLLSHLSNSEKKDLKFSVIFNNSQLKIKGSLKETLKNLLPSYCGSEKSKKNEAIQKVQSKRMEKFSEQRQSLDVLGMACTMVGYVSSPVGALSDVACKKIGNPESIYNNIVNNKQKIENLPVSIRADNQIFHEVSQQEAETIIDNIGDGNLRLSFDSLEREDMEQIVYFSDEHHDDACFQLENLTADTARKIINAIDEEESPCDVFVKKIENELSKISSSKSWLSEQKANGLLYLFDAKERTPMPWKSIFLLATLGISEMGYGAVSEGAADIMKSVTTLFTRECNLKHHLIQKTLSVGIMSGLVDDVAFATTRIINATRSWKIIGEQLSKVACKEVLAVSVDTAFKSAKETLCSQLKTKITDYASVEMKKLFAQANWLSVMNRVFAADYYIGNHFYENLVKQKAELVIANIMLSLPGVTGIGEFQQRF